MPDDQDSTESDGTDDDRRRASAEAVLADYLEVPTSVEALYLEEASPFRPIATGDVFKGVRVPGSTDDESAHGLAAIVAHPSGMRKGALLEVRAQAAPVIPISGVRKTSWTENRFDIFPLPQLSRVAARNHHSIPNAPWAADLRLCGPVETGVLRVRDRVACLAPEGVALLLQRLVHTDTRAVVRVKTLGDVFRPKLEELELLETWVESILSTVLAPEDAGFDDAVGDQAIQFDRFLNAIDPRLGLSARDLIDDDLRRSEGRQLIEIEIERRELNRLSPS